MDERILRFRVGVVVLATFLVTAILILMFSGRQTLLHATYTVTVHFNDAPGVTKDTPVRKFGILIGRVTEVHFADQDDLFPEKDGVNVTLALDATSEVYEKEICRINSSFLGDAVIQFVQGTGKGELVRNGDRLYGYVIKNPIESLASLEDDLRRTVISVGSAGENFGELSQHINSMISSNDDQISRIINKTETALDDLRQAAQNANSILSDSEIRDGLRNTLRDLPKILGETRDAIASVRTAANAAQTNLSNLEQFTAPLGENGSAIAENIESSVSRLDSLLEEMVVFTHALNRSDGSLGKLIHDPELYQRVNKAAMNIEEVTRMLKPIAYDAHVAMDKVARDPGGELGLRGALKKKAPIK